MFRQQVVPHITAHFFIKQVWNSWKPLALHCEEPHLNLRSVPAARSLSRPPLEHINPKQLMLSCVQVCIFPSCIVTPPNTGDDTFLLTERGLWGITGGWSQLTGVDWLMTLIVFVLYHDAPYSSVCDTQQWDVCPAAVLDTFSTKQIAFGATVLICLIPNHFLSFLSGIRGTVPMGNSGSCVDFSFEKILQKALLSKGFYIK